jgi:hypothetical protein
MKNIPFNQRIGTGAPDRPLDQQVPESARIGLIGVLNKLTRKEYVPSWEVLATEALQVGRHLAQDFQYPNAYENICVLVVKEMAWEKFYIFCERVHRMLQPPQYYDEDRHDVVIAGTLEEAQMYYSDEINQLLAEENLAYEFAEGIFQRRGRPQTRKSLQRVSSVLSDPHYSATRSHYNKAVKFFNERPEPDVKNCVKEAVCSLEAFTEILFGKKAAKDFDAIIRSKQGHKEGEIPPTIADGIIKLRAFRGNAQGVAHAATFGGYVGDIEAELVLSLVASYITYLYDRFPTQEEHVPF